MRLKDGAGSILASLLLRLGNSIRPGLRTIGKIAKERAEKEKRASRMSISRFLPVEGTAVEYACLLTSHYATLVANILTMDLANVRGVASELECI